MADTGCQSCLIGLKLVHQLVFNRSAADLINVQHKMNAVNREAIKIIRALMTGPALALMVDLKATPAAVLDVWNGFHSVPIRK